LSRSTRSMRRLRTRNRDWANVYRRDYLSEVVVPSKQSMLVVLTCIVVVSLGTLGYAKIAARSLGGTWLRSTKDGGAPDVMRLRLESGQFKLSFETPRADLESMTFELDGREHPWSAPYGSFGLETHTFESYSAQQSGSTVLITKQFAATSNYPAYSQVERWSLSDNGHQLNISDDRNDVSYSRAPMTRALFAVAP
jgi:hypothetical protein